MACLFIILVAIVNCVLYFSHFYLSINCWLWELLWVSFLTADISKHASCLWDMFCLPHFSRVLLVHIEQVIEGFRKSKPYSCISFPAINLFRTFYACLGNKHVAGIMLSPTHWMCSNPCNSTVFHPFPWRLKKKDMQNTSVKKKRLANSLQNFQIHVNIVLFR